MDDQEIIKILKFDKIVFLRWCMVLKRFFKFSGFNWRIRYTHIVSTQKVILKLSLAMYSEWLTSKHTENNQVLILRPAGLLLTCETGARWSGAFGNQMWVKGCVIEKYLNLKAEICVCCLNWWKGNYKNKG